MNRISVHIPGSAVLRLAAVMFLALESPAWADDRVPKAAPGAASPSGAIGNPAMRDELLKRRDLDQEIRSEMTKAGWEHPDEAIGARMGAIDRDNTARIKEIIKQYGWPGPELIGADGSFALWLLVQHSEPEFQEQVLPLVRDAYLAKKLPGQCYALLLDRVLVREGKPQVYGSQARPISDWKNHVPVLETIDDVENVDRRRAEVGLPPLSAYIQSLKHSYFPNDK